MTKRGWQPPPSSSEGGESCFRVPILLSATVTVHFQGDRRQREKHGYERIGVVSNHQPWGPIFSARDAASAIEKAKAVYPAAELGEPKELHGPGTHTSAQTFAYFSSLARGPQRSQQEVQP